VHDQAAEYASAWASFSALEHVAPHRADWATWAAGRRWHALFMALVREPGVVAAIAEVQARLQGVPGLELHARHFFHISIQSCGFDDAVPIDAERVAAALAELEDVDVVLGGVNAFHSAVFLETHSAGGLLQVRHALRGALGEPIAAVDPYPGFLFHLTLGYLGPACDVPGLRAQIAQLRGHETAHLRIATIDLVQVPTDQRVAFPDLEPISSFALGRR